MASTKLLKKNPITQLIFMGIVLNVALFLLMLNRSQNGDQGNFFGKSCLHQKNSISAYHENTPRTQESLQACTDEGFEI